MDRPPSTAGRRLWCCLAPLAALLALLVAAPAAPAASPFTGGPIAADTPLYIANDHTVTAIRFAATAGLQADTVYHVKVRFSPAPAPMGSANRGFIWNAATGQWVQERAEWADFPTVTTDAGGQVLESPWFFVKFGDTTLSGTYYVLVSLSIGVKGATLNGTAAPEVTVLDMAAATGGGFCVHDGVATGQVGGARAAAVADGLTALWGLQRAEPNGCDDDANGTVDDEDYGAAGATGDFRLAVPAGQAFDVYLDDAVWPPALPSFTASLAGADIAYGAADQTPPTVPADLTAVASSDKVELTWSAATDLGVSGLAGYVVYRWTDAVQIGESTSYTPAPIAVGTTTATGFTDTAVTLGTPYYYSVRAVDVATNAGPQSAQVTATPKLATAATLAATKAVVPWRGDAAMTWQLTEEGGGDLFGAPATIDFSTDAGVSWTALKDLTVTAPGPATAVATPDLSRRTWYRIRYDGDATHAPSLSVAVEIAPRVLLGRPSAPRAVAHGVRFTSVGTLAPRHRAGAKTVRIQCYKRVAGVWKLKKTVAARNMDKSGITQYRATFALPSAGAWKLVAFHPDDALHAATKSVGRVVTVR
jgi:hypothetical protein